MLSNFLKYKQKYPSMSLFFNWTVVDLQCVNFRCTAKWFSYTYIHAFFFFFRFFPLTGYYKILRNDRVILPLKTLKWETTKPCNGSPLLWESSANSLTRLMGQWCRLLPPLQPPSPPLPTTPTVVQSCWPLYIPETLQVTPYDAQPLLRSLHPRASD